MKKAFVTLCLGLFVSTTASSATITYENRSTNAGVDTTNYQSSWDNQTSYIYQRDLEAFKGLRATGSNRHQHSHLNISFDVDSSAAGMDWWFQFSPDAGLGGEMYFNGNLVERDTSNLWWGYRWNRTSELLEAVLDDVNTGTHTIDLYWAENCCNGGQSGRFSIDNGVTWLAVSTENLESVNVSEPGSWALLGLGLAGASRFPKKAKVNYIEAPIRVPFSFRRGI